MKLTLSEIASHVYGEVMGDSDCVIIGVSEIQDAKPHTITFLGNPLYRKYLIDTKADAIFVNNAKLLEDKNGIVVKNPQLAMAKTLALFSTKETEEPHIDPRSVISEGAVIGKSVTIESGVVIHSGVKIGDRCRIRANCVIEKDTILGIECILNPNVSIYENTILGDNVIIHSNTVIGCDGFGYVTVEDVHEKIPQEGNVIIGNNVEIGSNCAIDRGTIGSTIIGDMTKIDNLVHIAHNVKIGQGCLLTAGFAIAGSSVIGDFCTFAGQVGVAPHLKVGDRSIVASKSGITKSLKGNKVYAGFPAREIKDYNKREALISEVGRIRKKLDALIQANAED